MFGWIRKKITKIQEKRKAKKEVKKLKKLAKKQAGQIPIEEQDNFATLNQDEPVDTASQLDDMDDLVTDETDPTDMAVEVHAHMEEDENTDIQVEDDAGINDTEGSNYTDSDVPLQDDIDVAVHNDVAEAVPNDEEESAFITDTEIHHQAVIETENPIGTEEDDQKDPEIPDQICNNDLERICADPQVQAFASWIIESLRHRWFSDDTVFYWGDQEQSLETDPIDPQTEQTTDTNNTDQDHRESGDPSATSTERWIPVCTDSDQKVRVNRCGSEPELTEIANDDTIQYARNHERFKRRRWDWAARPSFLSTLKAN